MLLRVRTARDRKPQNHLDGRSKLTASQLAEQLECLKSMILLLQRHADPVAIRVYVAILAKQHYLNSEKKEPRSGEGANQEALLKDLANECDQLRHDSDCYFYVKNALNEFAIYIGQQNNLAIHQGRRKKGMTPEQIKARFRSQYGFDFEGIA